MHSAYGHHLLPIHAMTLALWVVSLQPSVPVCTATEPPRISDAWVATDALGRNLPGHTEVGDPRPDRTVALFYWTWHIGGNTNLGPANTDEIISRHRDAINITKIYEDVYKPGRFKDLWFYWKGKPLLMGYPDNLPEPIRSFFTFRPGQPDYRKGPSRPNQWGWLRTDDPLVDPHDVISTNHGHSSRWTVSVLLSVCSGVKIVMPHRSLLYVVLQIFDEAQWNSTHQRGINWTRRRFEGPPQCVLQAPKRGHRVTNRTSNHPVLPASHVLLALGYTAAHSPRRSRPC